MPTVISHGVAATAFGSILPHGRVPMRFWILTVLCAMLPDIDVVSFAFGFRYDDMLGHRGLTHSLSFALIAGIVAAWIASRATAERQKVWMLTLYFFLVTASHGVLDAMTNGGRGIAFFSPFSNVRYFFPWRPIQVSPLSVSAFFGERGLAVFGSEILWIWIPSAVIIAAARFLKSGKTKG